MLTRDWHQEARRLRQACVNCGACHQGCRNGAKASMDTTYLPLAVARRAPRSAPTRMVHGIELDAAGPGHRASSTAATASTAASAAPRCSSAAGGVETPRLLLHTGLANRSGQVGRNFMAHGATQVWGRFDEEMRGYRGYPSSVITEDTRAPRRTPTSPAATSSRASA